MTLANQQPPLLDWHHTSIGQRVVLEEQPYLAEQVRRFHGDTMIWSGESTELADTVTRCMVRNCFYAAQPASQAHPELASFECQVASLALPASSVDGVVLHHALEREQDPRGALREVARVLVPGGRLVLCAFNALSLWGVRSLYSRVRDDAFTPLKFINPLRLHDWLAVLGLELDQRPIWLGYQLPLAWGQAESRAAEVLRGLQPPIGGIFILSAVKQALGGRIERRQPTIGRAKLAPVAYPKLSAWNRVGRDR